VTNKKVIKKLRDNAELAWASYGYFNLVGKKFKDKKDNQGNLLTITLHDILDMTYKGYVASGNTALFNPEQLDGDFTSTQAKNFFDKYDLLIHQPNTHSGFSATLFEDTQAQSNNTRYILAFRGTEFPNGAKNDIWGADKSLLFGNVPKEQYSDMLLFYRQCMGEIPFYVELDSMPQDKKSLEYELWLKIYQRSTESKYKPYIKESFLKDASKNPTKDNFKPPIDSTTKLNIVGHSLGGCLAQLFALSFSTDKDSSIINEVYTFNAPGAKDLKLYDTIIFISNTINESTQQYLIAFYTKELMDKAQELGIDASDLNSKITHTLKSIIYNEKNANTHFGISLSKETGDLGGSRIYYEKISYDLLQYYQTLTHNYNNRNKEDYKLSISDKVFHIESKNQADRYFHTKESYKENTTQHLGKDIEGNYFILNLNFGGMDSHKISSIAKILYFYAYLYEVNESLIDTTSKEVKIEYELHQNEFLKEHSEIDIQEYDKHKKALEYCNKISLSIHRILYDIEFQKALAKNPSDDMYIAEPPNWLYAIIEQRLFEATIKTQQNKFLIKSDASDIIEAILYLQENNVYIEILKEYTIKNITPNSPLSQLFAIHEISFFISTDENAQPLIKDNSTANRLIGHKTARAQIFCGNHKADSILVDCYKEATLKYYPKAINE